MFIRSHTLISLIPETKSIWCIYKHSILGMLNKSWRQHPTRRQLYGHLPPITKTIQVRRARHAGHCWRSKDELVSDVLQSTPTYGQAKAGQPARTYIQQLCEDTGCNQEDLPEAMNDREKWRERSGISVLAARHDDDDDDDDYASLECCWGEYYYFAHWKFFTSA